MDSTPRSPMGRCRCFAMLALIGFGVSACKDSTSAGGPGSLVVSVATTGDDADPSYQIAMAGVAPYLVGPNATLELGEFDAGQYDVSISDVASNCIVQNNSRRVTVKSGASTLVTFAVTCRARAAALRITFVSSGPDQPTNFAATVQTVGTVGVPANGSATVANLPPLVNVTVSAANLPANCSVTGDASKTVTIPVVGTAVVELAVTCVPNVGSVSVTTTTTGVDLDTDGYLLMELGLVARVPTASVTQLSLKAGSHAFTLGGLAPNCALQGPSTVNANVLYGTTVSVAFNVNCTAAEGGPHYMIAFESNLYSGKIITGTQVCTVRSDGQQRRCHTAATRHVYRPTWLPDGSRLGYGAQSGGLFTVGPGGDEHRVSSLIDWVTTSDWSNDGDRIVFQGAVSGVAAMYIMNADGTNPALLGPGSSPSFSPDGTRIVFSRHDGTRSNIYSMAATGGDLKQLTSGSESTYPTYSPDGTKILFTSGVTGGGWQLKTMNVDGSGVTAIPGLVNVQAAQYSADGLKIVYERFVPEGISGIDIYVANADGSGARRVTSNADSRFPQFQPPGTTVFGAARSPAH